MIGKFASVMVGVGVAMFFSTYVNAELPKDERCYELRVYTAADGKLDALNARFRNHTTKLFEKHGITNLGYWTPVPNPDRKLYYFISYPSREVQKTAWAAFASDPDWVSAKTESEKDGKLVDKVESSFFHAASFSPEIKSTPSKTDRLYELRTYTSSAGNLDRLLKRFETVTMGLFKKHGAINYGYWVLDKDQKGSDETLVYMLIYNSAEQKAESNKAFGMDPAWIEAKATTEKEAGGPLTAPNGVKSVILTPTDYSKSK